jgi:TM2 domain-containing membrane protein YozV
MTSRLLCLLALFSIVSAAENEISLLDTIMSFFAFGSSTHLMEAVIQLADTRTFDVDGSNGILCEVPDRTTITASGANAVDFSLIHYPSVKQSTTSFSAIGPADPSLLFLEIYALSNSNFSTFRVNPTYQVLTSLSHMASYVPNRAAYAAGAPYPTEVSLSVDTTASGHTLTSVSPQNVFLVVIASPITDEDDMVLLPDAAHLASISATASGGVVPGWIASEIEFAYDLVKHLGLRWIALFSIVGLAYLNAKLSLVFSIIYLAINRGLAARRAHRSNVDGHEAVVAQVVAPEGPGVSPPVSSIELSVNHLHSRESSDPGSLLTDRSEHEAAPRPPHSLPKAYASWAIFGIFGAHRFLLGYKVTGAIYACTLGIFLVGHWVDGIFLMRYLVRHANERDSTKTKYVALQPEQPDFA